MFWPITFNFTKCKFLHNCKFCVTDVNYDPLMEKVILLSLLTISYFSAISYFSPVNWWKFFINRLGAILFWLQHSISITRNGLFTLTSWSWTRTGMNQNEVWNEVVKLISPPFYKRLVHIIYSRRNIFSTSCLIWSFNFLAAEVDSGKFLDTKIILNNEGVVTTQVHQKENEKNCSLGF